MVEELHGRCAVVIMSGPLRILDWVCGWLRGFDRVGVGGGIEKGKKRKTKNEQEKKRREKKYGEKCFDNQQGIEQQTLYNLLAPLISVTPFLDVVSTVFHAIHQLLVEDLQDPFTATTTLWYHPFFVRG